MPRYSLGKISQISTTKVIYFNDVFPTFNDFEDVANSYYPDYDPEAINEQWFNIITTLINTRPLKWYPEGVAKLQLVLKWITFYKSYKLAKAYTDKTLDEILALSNSAKNYMFITGEDSQITTKELFDALSDEEKVKYLQGVNESIATQTTSIIQAMNTLDNHYETLTKNNPLDKLLNVFVQSVTYELVSDVANESSGGDGDSGGLVSSNISDDVLLYPNKKLNIRLSKDRSLINEANSAIEDNANDIVTNATNIETNIVNIATNSNDIGDITKLETDDKSSLVNAVNELANSDLTTVTSSIVINDATDSPSNGINPVINQVSTNETDITTNATNIGDLTTLTTSDKTSVVNAINEVKSSSGSVSSIVSDDSSDSPDSGINPKLNQITTNTTDITTNKTNIATNTTNIQTNTTNINTIVAASNKVNLTYSKGTNTIVGWTTSIDDTNILIFTPEQSGSLISDVVTYSDLTITFLKDCDFNLTFYIVFNTVTNANFQIQATINGTDNADATNIINNPNTSDTYTFVFIRSMKANDTLKFYGVIDSGTGTLIESTGTYIATFFMVDSSTTVDAVSSNVVNDTTTNPTLGINPDLIQIQTNTTNIGDMSTLLTTDKSSLVNAINELKGDEDAYDGS